VANFCFAEQRRELFEEALLRGWWQSCIDFPQHDGMPQGLLAPDELRPEVCCISDDLLYRTLVVSAWCCGYTGTEQVCERDRFLMATALKPMSHDEGMALLRRGIAHDTREIEKAWRSLCAAMPVFE